MTHDEFMFYFCLVYLFILIIGLSIACFVENKKKKGKKKND